MVTEVKATNSERSLVLLHSARASVMKRLVPVELGGADVKAGNLNGMIVVANVPGDTQLSHKRTSINF